MAGTSDVFPLLQYIIILLFLIIRFLLLGLIYLSPQASLSLVAYLVQEIW